MLREITEEERRILGFWPRYEDGSPVMLHDVVEVDDGPFHAYGINFHAGEKRGGGALRARR